MVNSFCHALEEMVLPPFTLQRICELLLDEKTYTTWERYTFAMSKVCIYNNKWNHHT